MPPAGNASFGFISNITEEILFRFALCNRWRRPFLGSPRNSNVVSFVGQRSNRPKTKILGFRPKLSIRAHCDVATSVGRSLFGSFWAIPKRTLLLERRLKKCSCPTWHKVSPTQKPNALHLKIGVGRCPSGTGRIVCGPYGRKSICVSRFPSDTGRIVCGPYG